MSGVAYFTQSRLSNPDQPFTDKSSCSPPAYSELTSTRRGSKWTSPTCIRDCPPGAPPGHMAARRLVKSAPARCLPVPRVPLGRRLPAGSAAGLPVPVPRLRTLYLADADQVRIDPGGRNLLVSGNAFSVSPPISDDEMSITGYRYYGASHTCPVYAISNKADENSPLMRYRSEKGGEIAANKPHLWRNMHISDIRHRWRGPFPYYQSLRRLEIRFLADLEHAPRRNPARAAAPSASHYAPGVVHSGAKGCASRPLPVSMVCLSTGPTARPNHDQSVQASRAACSTVYGVVCGGYTLISRLVPPYAAYTLTLRRFHQPCQLSLVFSGSRVPLISAVLFVALDSFDPDRATLSHHGITHANKPGLVPPQSTSIMYKTKLVPNRFSSLFLSHHLSSPRPVSSCIPPTDPGSKQPKPTIPNKKMHAQSSLVALCGMVSLALGSVEVRPDDPYAFLAAEATSYEDLAVRVSAFVAASGEPHEPVPSPVVTPAQQQAMDELIKSMQPVERRNGTLAARQGGTTCRSYAPAYAPDMVRCVNYLASLGQQECRVGNRAYIHSQMCHDKSAYITAASGVHDRATNCATVAREAGHIMDMCTTATSEQISGYGFLEDDRYIEIILSGEPPFVVG
ncbi:uncharacterized protein PG986_002263 [Apiospora aurea]|uniref:Deuterolysin n=1 Tax=Apiospora aurea TaxID=335848 RepID=A0ABR1QZ47_9PEZI